MGVRGIRCARLNMILAHRKDPSQKLVQHANWTFDIVILPDINHATLPNFDASKKASTLHSDIIRIADAGKRLYRDVMNRHLFYTYTVSSSCFFFRFLSCRSLKIYHAPTVRAVKGIVAAA